MDSRTGDIYETKEKAIEAGVPENDMVQGEKQTLIKLRRHIRLSQKVRNRMYKRRQKKAQIQKESRKTNR